MTTRIHVVNLGPGKVEVETGAVLVSGEKQKVTLYHGDSLNEFVYDGKEVKITEK